ncbi:MAG TPA: nitrate- and nitrite sensing domain-containing protein [Rhodocyclaceae bacterium]|nr:nitrate- and nitrite sensing domain-containing protein [Rhodocyclaceae bacterium]
MNTLNLAILCALLLVIVIGVWFLRRRGREQSGHVEVARTAIQACNCLLQLIGHIQQHRGMSTAHLAGDHGFDRRLIEKRAEIEPLLAKLQAVSQNENSYSYPCFTPNDVSLWRHRWSSLVNELDSYTVEKSIATHSNLIATLLNWLGALGEARVELPMGEALPNGSVRNFAHRLPQLTETLGQARATGSGVAAKGSCSAVARVRLMFLVSRAESLIDQACAVDKQGSAAAQKVRALAELTRTHMLGSQKVGVSAEQYFAAATQAIDAVFFWVRECGGALEQQLANNMQIGKPGSAK